MHVFPSLASIVLVVVFTLARLPTASAAGFSLFGNSWGDIIVNTDMTPEGRALTRPTPEKPAYYTGQSLGCRFGSIAGDRLPDVKEMNDFVAKVLAKQGYLPAQPGVHEAELLLVLQWGYLRPQSGDLLWFLGYNAADDVGAPSFPGMIGPEVYRRSFRSRTIETVLDSASTEIYGIIVTAFDHSTAKSKEPVIYWQTRIGLAAHGKSMAAALPAMVVAAGPTIGRETTDPVLHDADDAREGQVELGELQVIGIVEEPEPSDPEGIPSSP